MKRRVILDEYKKDREVIEAATDGPWKHQAGTYRVFGPGPCTCGECHDSETVCRVLCRMPEDAAFVSRARTRWPAALDEVDRLRKERDQAREPINNQHGTPEECPTWYDGCNCNVETLVHNIERAERLDRELQEERSAAAANLNRATIARREAESELARLRSLLARRESLPNYCEPCTLDDECGTGGYKLQWDGQTLRCPKCGRDALEEGV